MNIIYIITLLILLGVPTGFIFYKQIKHSNYELNLKESVMFFLGILILTVISLIDFSLIDTTLVATLPFTLMIILLLFPIIYYIIRVIKIKKYIPIKTILWYIITSAIIIVFQYDLLNKVEHIDFSNAIIFFILYLFICSSYIALLLLINLTLLMIKFLKKDNLECKNKHYKISKLNILTIIVALMTIWSIFPISNFNTHIYNNLLVKERNIVYDYLNKVYPNYKFEIIDTYEERVNCTFMCSTPVYKNNVLNKTTNETFTILVDETNLTIYEDGYKELLKNGE